VVEVVEHFDLEGKLNRLSVREKHSIELFPLGLKQVCDSRRVVRESSVVCVRVEVSSVELVVV
jgi:hypothetical protein